MMCPQECRQAETLADALKKEGFSQIRFVSNETNSRKTAVRKGAPWKRADCKSRTITVKANVSGKTLSAVFSELPPAEYLVPLLKDMADLSENNEACEAEAAEIPQGTFLIEPFVMEAHEVVEALLLEAEREAYSVCKTALLETCCYEQIEKKVSVVSETGEVLFCDSTGCRCLRAAAMSKKDENTEYAAFCKYGNSLLDIEPKQLFRETAEEAADRLCGEPLASGSYQVILKNTVMAELLEAYLPAFYGENDKEAKSCLYGKKGKSVASCKLSVCEKPFAEGGRVTRRIDDEGTKVREKFLIKNGKLTSLLYSSESAREAGEVSTGNGFTDGGNGIGTGVTNIFLEADADIAEDTEEMLARLENGIFVTAVDGIFAGTDIKTGAFSLIAKGKRIKAGKVAGAFREVAVSGNFFTLLKEVKGVGKVYMQTPPDCESVAAPDVRAGSITVSGT